jgi:hypothetical protein
MASFDEDGDEIRNAIKCMALVIAEHISADGRVETYFGTAFFISEKLLLTAGHNVYGSPNLKITGPGIPHIKYATVGSRRITAPTIDCKVVATLYKNQDGPSHHDIAILHAGTYNANSYLKLSSHLPPLPSKVNVIGYPGTAAHNWLLCHEGIADIDISRKATDEMFPAHRITITSGPVATAGKTISYKLSTIRGMSGGCVLYNGNVVGIPCY